MLLIKYIEKYYDGNQSEFARFCGVHRTQVTQWINKGFIVVDETLYSPRRRLAKENINIKEEGVYERGNDR